MIEGGSASFVVSMGASEKQVTVSYETEDGTAAETGDYTSTSGALTFEAGATTKTVTVVTANDTVDEADGETFTVKLSDPVNATLATDGTVATGTINDNDDPAVLSIADATAVIEGGSASFVVSMGASEKQVTVSYETADGTAAETGDYTSTSGALTFEAGATTKTVTVVTANVHGGASADGESWRPTGRFDGERLTQSSVNAIAGDGDRDVVGDGASDQRVVRTTIQRCCRRAGR